MKMNDMPSTKKMPAVWLLPCLALLMAVPASALEPRKDVIHDLKEWPMYSSPTIGRSTEKIVHSPELIPLWMAALKSEELDLQRQAADTIVIARRAGVEGLEKMIPTLMEIARHPEPHPTVLAAVCRALIALDHRPAAPRLLELVKQDKLLLCQLIEPGLADWKDPGAIQVWRTRLEQPGRSLPLSMQPVRSWWVPLWLLGFEIPNFANAATPQMMSRATRPITIAVSNPPTNNSVSGNPQPVTSFRCLALPLLSGSMSC